MKSGKPERRVENAEFATSCEVLRRLFPTKKSNRMAGSTVDLNTERFPFCHVYMNSQGMTWRRLTYTYDMMYTNNLQFNLQILA